MYNEVFQIAILVFREIDANSINLCKLKQLRKEPTFFIDLFSQILCQTDQNIKLVTVELL